MKAYLINMHLLVPRSRSSAKVKVKYKGYISQEIAVSGAFMFHKHILFIFKAKVILGEEREATGSLLSIDGGEGVIKLENGEIKMLPIRFLCKMPH